MSLSPTALDPCCQHTRIATHCNQSILGPTRPVAEFGLRGLGPGMREYIGRGARDSLFVCLFVS